ncbi:MarR family winged helix-turn-helix transcriptional regulator [Roseococcus sp. YIM B11640]|uniref:MarR family winged helix-turn-helix transcriptional regulator n=1 Tax=Roseococcus sp. YIM B11640 TaxID=3133973 RepID=UPI003C7B47E0
MTQPPLRHLLTANLLQASRNWRRLAQEAMAAHGISDARAAPLIWVSRLGGGVRQVTLAGHIGIEGPSLVRLLDQLGAAGLIERREDPDDRRAKTIWLTPEGEAMAARIEMVLTDLRERIFAGISDEEIAAAQRIFDAMSADHARRAPEAVTA